VNSVDHSNIIFVMFQAVYIGAHIHCVW